MSGKHRPLLPAPPADTAGWGKGPQRDDEEPSMPVRKRRIGTSRACNLCRKQKSRCSGDKPTCQTCQAKGTVCEYEKPWESKNTLKNQNERLGNDLSTLLELYWYLQNKPIPEASRVFDAIRSGSEPSAVLDLLNVDRSGSSTSAAPNQPPSEPIAGGSQTEENAADKDERAQSPDENPLQAALQSPNATLALKNGVESFYKCTGCIFHTYDREESDELLSMILEDIDEAGGDMASMVFESPKSPQRNAALCAIAIVAAVGLQYTRDPIRSMNLPAARENGTSLYVNVFYQVAKELLEDAIEDNMLEAMKVCAVMTMFNVIAHSTVALAYADMGLGFALNHGLNHQVCPADVDESKWINYKRVARTLVILRNWLVATLGYLPGDDLNYHSVVHWLIDRVDLSPKDVVQQEMAKVTVIKAKLLRTFDTFKDVSPLTLRSMRRDLLEWFQGLPEWMHVEFIKESQSVPQDIRLVIFLVHLFYLSTQLLVARVALGKQLYPTPRYDIEEVRDAVIDAVVAARNGAQVLRMQTDDQVLFPRCWLSEYTAYMCCLTLMHSTALMIYNGYPKPVWQEELSRAKTCLDVLVFCGTVDSVGNQFAETAREFHDMLSRATDETVGSRSPTTDMDVSGDFNYLFTTSQASSPLQAVSQKLLELISHPFGSAADLPGSGSNVEGPGAGARLDWNSLVASPFNRLAPEQGGSRLLFHKALSSMSGGRFVGRLQPHGWNTIRPSAS